MKKITAIIAVAFIFAASQSAFAFDPKELFGKLSGNSNSEETEQTDNNESSEKGGGFLDALGGFVNNLAANKKFSVDDLVGTWNYVEPAVTFQSDNAFKKIGGAGAATAVEDKLAPYYTKLGFNRTSLTVDEEHNFVLKMGLLTLKGKVEKDDNDLLVFSFNAFNKIPLGKVSANATKSGSQLNLTFEATKMVQLLTKVASVLNSKALNTLTSLLNSYDGIYMGFKLKAQ